MPLRLVTLAGDPEREAAIASEISGRRDVELVLRCMDRIELLGAIRGGGLDAIVSVGAPMWLDSQAVEEAALAEVRIVGVVSDARDADRLAEFGAALVPAGAGPEEIIERCTTSEVAPVMLPSTQPSGERGRLIAVWGPKGAPGRTTIAIELAVELAAEHPETVLIDGDPFGGDVVQLLGIVEELPTVVWAAQLAAADRLGAEVIAGDLRRAGRAGPVVVPGLPRADLWADVSEFGWRRLLGVARAAFKFAVCDVGFCLERARPAMTSSDQSRARMARTAVEEAHRVVAVCGADPVGIKNFLWAFDALRELVDPDDIIVVANRVRRSREREVADVLRRHTGKRPVAYIPDRPHEVDRAVAAGAAVREVFPGGDVATAMRTLAAALGGRVRARGMMAKLSGGR